MKFWKFWSILILVVFALVTGQVYFGLTEFILAYDQTYITFLNIGILLLSQILLLRLHLKKQYQEFQHKLVRYFGESTVALGLIGTLIGFMLVLWSVFGPGVVIDPGNTVAMTEILIKMSQGMAAALITSLSGIITSTIIGLQLVLLEE